MTGWKLKKISEVCDLIVDCVNKTAPKVSYPTPYKMIRTPNIRDGRINLDDCRFVDEETYKKWTRRATVDEGDVLLTREAPMGEVGRVGFKDTVFLGQRIVQYRANAKELDSHFLLYSFRSAFLQAQFRKYDSSGSIVSHIPVPACTRFQIPTPPIPTQKKIAQVLSTLDAKIELNNRINRELEGLAKLLYDYWFVQFDFPISAEQAKAIGNPKLEGRPYRASGGKMVFNEKLKREIPEGWTDGNLLQIATFTNGLACQKYPPDGGETLRVIKIKEMRTGLTPDSDLVRADVPQKVKIQNGDILFSWSASLEVMIWAGGEGALNQHIFKVTSDTYPRSFCYFVLLDYLQHFRMIAELRKTTMGHITNDHLEQSKIIVPPDDVAKAFEAVAKPIIDRLVKSHEENLELTQLRDWLLPMLMNGQVTVGS
ncbi:MAG: restriction endonuclease subunit S [Proteobacteria bacterium]|nr:restriction endonuclease subunit S [Pseudomonadota bacterium]